MGYDDVIDEIGNLLFMADYVCSLNWFHRGDLKQESPDSDGKLGFDGKKTCPESSQNDG